MRRLTDVELLTARFYDAMPGTPRPPMEDGNYLWSEVNNDHWNFCERIAAEIVGLRSDLAELRAYVMAIRSPLP